MIALRRPRVILWIAATLVLVTFAVLNPAEKYPALFFVCLGLAFTWREIQRA